MKLPMRSILCFVLLLGSLVGGVTTASAATSTATLTAGSLTITSPATDFTYTSTALTGSQFNLTSAFTVGVTDATGSKAGWNLQATIGVLTANSGADTIPAANHTITSAPITTVTGTGPTNSITYPMQIPTTAAKIFSAAANTGKGISTETFNTQLVVPPDAAAGTYTAVLTVSVVSGP